MESLFVILTLSIVEFVWWLYLVPYDNILFDSSFYALILIGSGSGLNRLDLNPALPEYFMDYFPVPD